MKFAPFQLWQAPEGRDVQEVTWNETELMIKSEDMGYDATYLAEHHFCTYSPSGAPEVAPWPTWRGAPSAFAWEPR